MFITHNYTFLGALVVISLSFTVLIIPRNKILLPIFLVTTYVTFGQSIELSSYTFTPLRILILAYILRLFFAGGLKLSEFNSLDKAIILWLILTILLALVRNPSTEMFTYKMGFIYNNLGLYIIFRSIIKDKSDIIYYIRWLSLIIIPLAIIMLYETFTGNNLFSYLGGVPFHSWVRNGYVRAQGPFRHAILAGTFGATLIPFMWYMWVENKGNRTIYFFGLLAGTSITISSHSSGPLMTYVFAIVALFLWKFRENIKTIRSLTFTSLILLSMIMTAPIWYIMVKISNIIGGSGWHRAFLIDQAIRYFSEWWIVGTDDTAHWMPYTLSTTGGADITNNFIAQGVDGGIVLLAIFVYTLYISFKYIGVGIKIDNNKQKYLLWTMGATLFAHITAFMSVTYFDQIIVMYYFLLSSIAMMYDTLIHKPFIQTLDSSQKVHFISDESISNNT